MKIKNKKDLILDYVETYGKKGARYTDVIKFIYEHNHPKLKYDHVWNRGYYSCAFSGWDPYLLTGANRLEKVGKRYFAIKGNKA